MSAPTGEVERVAAALEDLIHDAPEPEIERVLTESLALLRSLAKDAERLELALATERGKLEKADAVADAWARGARRLDLIERRGSIVSKRIEGQSAVCTVQVELRWHMDCMTPLTLREAIDRAIEAAGRKEGGGSGQV
jgi:hypothetical protein